MNAHELFRNMIEKLLELAERIIAKFTEGSTSPQDILSEGLSVQPELILYGMMADILTAEHNEKGEPRYSADANHLTDNITDELNWLLTVMIAYGYMMATDETVREMAKEIQALSEQVVRANRTARLQDQAISAVENDVKAEELPKELEDALAQLMASLFDTEDGDDSDFDFGDLED